MEAEVATKALVAGLVSVEGPGELSLACAKVLLCEEPSPMVRKGQIQQCWTSLVVVLEVAWDHG